MEREPHRQPQPGVDDVVPVADIDYSRFLPLRQVFPDGEIIGHYLAGVVVVGEAIYDWNSRVLRQLEDVGMVEQPRHYQVVVAAEKPRDVLDGFALANADVLRPEEERMPSHPAEAGLEGDSRAR